LRAGRRWRRPKLIGLGYEFQRVERLAAGVWDVPLDALITEQGLYSFKGSP
jgi:5-formyltetrahydrofolate cyclo-ligase